VPLEKSIEAACKRLVEAEGGEWIKLLPWVSTGLPDRLMLLPGGRVVFVEMKAPRGRLRPRQAWWMRRLTGLGFEYAIARTPAELEHVIVYPDRPSNTA